MSVAFLKALFATLVLVLFHADGRFFVTADSRTRILSNGMAVPSEGACKLINAGRIVFFETGYPKGWFGGKPIFDGENIARGLILEHRNEPLTEQSVESLADLWARRLKADVETYQQIPGVEKVPDGAAGVFLASVADGTTFGTVRDLSFEENGKVSITPQRVVSDFLAVGDHRANVIANRRFQEIRNRNAFRDDPAKLLYQIESDTITELNSPGVGGPIDELVLGPNRAAEWIHQKPNCQ